MHPLGAPPPPKPNRFIRELTRYIRFESVDIYIKLMFTQDSHWRAEDFFMHGEAHLGPAGTGSRLGFRNLILL